MRVPSALPRFLAHRPVAFAALFGGFGALGTALTVALSLSATPATATLRTTADAVAAASSAPVPPLEVQRSLVILRGGTLAATLTKLGFSSVQVKSILASNPAASKPVTAKTALTLSYTESAPYTIEQAHLTYRPTPVQELSLFLRGTYAKAVAENKPLSDKTTGIVGVIRNSLYEDATRAGMSPQQVTAFMNLFAWDLDYTRDIHPGDSFKVMFDETVTDQGVRIKSGRILAAAFTVAGETRYAYWYGTDKGGEYLNEKGESKRKLLLRTPLEFARISSSFGVRNHPVLGFTRMHKGTDFAASEGTPVKASGDGVVVFEGPHGGHGNYLKIEHNKSFTTGYAHLSRFAKGIRPGSRVKQGQIVAYVGNTGVSTGPHLHYEVMKNGQFVDAMRTDLPTGSPLTKTQLAQFKARVKQAQGLWASAPAAKRVAMK